MSNIIQDDTDAALNSYESTKDGETPSAPKERLKDAMRLRSIHHHLVDMDEASERNRAKVQNLKDFKPPLDEGILPIDPESGLPVFDLSLIGVGGK